MNHDNETGTVEVMIERSPLLTEWFKNLKGSVT
jgi:hypothetical protein